MRSNAKTRKKGSSSRQVECRNRTTVESLKKSISQSIMSPKYFLLTKSGMSHTNALCAKKRIAIPLNLYNLESAVSDASLFCGGTYDCIFDVNKTRIW